MQFEGRLYGLKFDIVSRAIPGILHLHFELTEDATLLNASDALSISLPFFKVTFVSFDKSLIRSMRKNS